MNQSEPLNVRTFSSAHWFNGSGVRKRKQIQEEDPVLFYERRNALQHGETGQLCVHNHVIIWLKDQLNSAADGESALRKCLKNTKLRKHRKPAEFPV